jgi:predicted transcriptional regulator of viral defense system
LYTSQHNDPNSLAELVDELQAGGRYTLTRDEAITALGITDMALTKAVQRLVTKNRLTVPHRGFFVIVPIEYRQAGAPPPDWYIGDLMAFSNRPYYVGLLSAASLHGAAHQQPQEFQVITDMQLRSVEAGRGRVRFFKKSGMKSTPFVDVKTETGLMRVSTPEVTALDLLRYLDAAGHLGHVTTVMAELAEKMDPMRTLEAAKSDGSLPNAQRLGHLLDLVGAGDLGRGLAGWIAERRPRYLALRPDRPSDAAPKDRRWRLLVNETIEVES